jgi:hypothetical protein
MMIKHLLLLTFLSACLVIGAEAQLKFGVAAGYEHLSSTTSQDMTSSGGLAGSLLFRYPLCPHWEMDLAPAIGIWKSSYTFDRQIIAPNFGLYLDRPIDYQLTVIHITVPLYICYVLPVDQSSFFGGPGFFWSNTNMTATSLTAGGQAPIVNAVGLSLLAGIRGEHWQMSADYRPWLHNYRHTGEQFDGRLSNDLSIKIGYLFGKVKKKG